MNIGKLISARQRIRSPQPAVSLGGIQGPSISEIYKHSALECMAAHLPTDVNLLIDWHSGAGRTEMAVDGKTMPYDGNALRVMDAFSKRGMRLSALLTEPDDDLRAALETTMAGKPDVTIIRRWHDNTRHYVGYANSHALSIIDPERGTSYYDDQLLMYATMSLYTGGHCLITMKEHTKLPIHAEVVRKIYDVTRNSEHYGVDLYHPVVEDGDIDFAHHNFVISTPEVIDACERQHNALLAQDPGYAKFPYDGGAKRIMPLNIMDGPHHEPRTHNQEGGD